MGWLIALCVLILLLLMPVGIKAAYTDRGASAQLGIGPLSFALYPRTKITKTNKSENNHKTGSFETKVGRTSSDKGGNLTDFFPLMQIVLEALGALRRKLRVKRLEMKLILGGNDPCDLSINYGRAWTALGNLMPLLEQVFIIKKRNLEVECDYTSGETLFFARLNVSITIGRLLYLAIYYGVRMLREYLKIQNKRKGGAAI